MPIMTSNDIARMAIVPTPNTGISRVFTFDVPLNVGVIIEGCAVEFEDVEVLLDIPFEAEIVEDGTTVEDAIELDDTSIRTFTGGSFWPWLYIGLRMVPSPTWP